jgi:hypothetical protein
MNEQQHLAERFEENRGHLPAVAYRILGSLSEAEDAVQERPMRVELITGYYVTPPQMCTAVHKD